MQITISTHNGGGASVINLAHNRREEWIVKRENEAWEKKHPGELRIDPEGKYEILFEEDIQKAYEEEFSEALKAFNQKQVEKGHKDRVIKDYLKHIKAKEHESKSSTKYLYEMIYAVGSRDNPIDSDTAENVLKEVALSFQERHPNLRVTGIYLHQDESGVPHVHLNYFAVARDMKRGMRIQNSLSAALKQEGFISLSYSETAQMAFERAENNYLEQLLKKRGYEVAHPQRGTHAEHLSILEYKLEKKVEKQQELLSQTQDLPLGKTIVSKGRLEQLEEIETKYQADKPKIEKAERDLRTAQNAMEAYNKSLYELEKKKKAFDDEVNKAAIAKMQLLRDAAYVFLKENNELYENFKLWLDAHQTLSKIVALLR